LGEEDSARIRKENGGGVKEKAVRGGGKKKREWEKAVILGRGVDRGIKKRKGTTNGRSDNNHRLEEFPMENQRGGERGGGECHKNEIKKGN